jgi:sarcosine oxidase
MPAENRYDAIVVGVGGMGSAALHHLARRGRRVLGLEQFDVPNELGSSHGVTRIIRLAYFEHPDYVPLLRRAYALWRELEQRAGEQLLHVHGSIDAGRIDGRVVAGALRSCLEHDLEHELMDARELRRRFPAYRLPDEFVALLQPEGGFLLPERCIVAHVEAARVHGAEVRTSERVLGWEPAGDGVSVTTDRATYTAGRLVLTAGAWMDTLMQVPRPLVTPERQVLGWFEPSRPELFEPARLPVFNVVVDEGHYYGFPVFGVPGFKLGRFHHRAEVVDPDRVSREPTPEDEHVLRVFAERYFPDGAGRATSLKVCLFENSPDEHFIVDLHPECPAVVLGGGFSGHGFKFCSVVGELLADLALEGETAHPIDLFRLARFGM